MREGSKYGFIRLYDLYVNEGAAGDTRSPENACPLYGLIALTVHYGLREKIMVFGSFNTRPTYRDSLSLHSHMTRDYVHPATEPGTLACTATQLRPVRTP